MKKHFRVIALLLVVGMLLTACVGPSKPEQTKDSDSQQTAVNATKKKDESKTKEKPPKDEKEEESKEEEKEDAEDKKEEKPADAEEDKDDKAKDKDEKEKPADADEGKDKKAEDKDKKPADAEEDKDDKAEDKKPAAAEEDKTEDKDDKAEDKDKKPADADEDKDEKAEDKKPAAAEDDKTEDKDDKAEDKKADDEASDEVEEKEINPDDYPRHTAKEDRLNKVLLEDKDHECENFSCYTITVCDGEDGNYFTYELSYLRIRDLAAVLADTDAKFNVEFKAKDEKNDKDVLAFTTGKAYKSDEEKDLIEREDTDDFKFVETDDLKVTVDGEEIEEFNIIEVEGELYAQIGWIRRALGAIYHNDLDEEAGSLTIYPFKSDIEAIDLDEFKKLMGGNEATYLFVWAGWCPFCHDEFAAGHVQEMMEYAKDHDAKIINIIGDYDNHNKKEFGESVEVEFNDDTMQLYGLSEEVAKYLNDVLLKDAHPLWFPTIILMDKDGEPVIEYFNTEDYSWVDLIEMSEDEIKELKELRAKEEAEEAEEAEEETKEESKEEQEDAADEDKDEKDEDKDKKPADTEEDKDDKDEDKKIEKLDPITIGLATDAGGVDDKAFNQGTWEGILKYAEDQELSEDKYQYVQATSDSDYVPQLTTYAEMGIDLIVAPGFLFKSAITDVANNYPDQKFLFIDDVSEAENVMSAIFAEHEGSFLVGVAAALKAEDAGKDKVGFIGGMDFETIQKFEAGFEQGVHAINPDIEVMIDYVGAFDHPEDAQAIATKMYDSGAYIIYPAAGSSGNGVIKEAKDRAINGEDVWVIGVDRNQYEEGIYEDDKSVILTSMVKRVDRVAYQVCEEVAKGEFKGGLRTFTMKDDAVNIPDENPNLKDEWIKLIDEYREKIVNDEIEVEPVPVRLQDEEEDAA